MATLDELRVKWFLSFPGLGTAFPTVRRHAGRDASAYTHGNLVEALIDGQGYMKEGHDWACGMISREWSELYHAGWRFDPVHSLGYSNPASDSRSAKQAKGSV